MKSRLLVVAIAFAALALVAAGCTKKDSSSSKTAAPTHSSVTAAVASKAAATAPKATDTPKPTATPAPPTATPTPNTMAKVGDLQITVNSVAPYTSSNQYMQPDAGMSFWAVDVTLENVGTGSYDVNVLNFKLTDSEKYSNVKAFAPGPDPQINVATLAKGETTRGFITFSVRTTAKPVSLHYASFTGKSGSVGLPPASGS